MSKLAGTVCGIVCGKDLNANKVQLGSLLNYLINLERNPDLVQVNSIDSVSQVTGTDISTGVSPNKLHILSFARTERIRQRGFIKKIDLPYLSPTNLTEFKFELWRENSTLYDKPGDINLLPLLTVGAGLKTVHIIEDIYSLEGDYYAYAQGSSIVESPIKSTTKTNGAYFTLDALNYGDGTNWKSFSPLNVTQIAHIFMQAPLMSCIGDSIMESAGVGNLSFIDIGGSQTNLSDSWDFILAEKDTRITYQNFGYSGDTTAQINGRFDSHITPTKSKICVINGGINDLAQGVSKANFINNWTLILEKCEANGMYAIVWEMMPWSNGSNELLQIRDDWNVSLRALVSKYNAVAINWDNIMGSYRIGGADGNLWDLRADYDCNDGLGIHPNALGNMAIANEVYRILRTKSTS